MEEELLPPTQPVATDVAEQQQPPLASEGAGSEQQQLPPLASEGAGAEQQPPPGNASVQQQQQHPQSATAAAPELPDGGAAAVAGVAPAPLQAATMEELLALTIRLNWEAAEHEAVLEALVLLLTQPGGERSREAALKRLDHLLAVGCKPDAPGTSVPCRRCYTTSGLQLYVVSEVKLGGGCEGRAARGGAGCEIGMCGSWSVQCGLAAVSGAQMVFKMGRTRPGWFVRHAPASRPGQRTEPATASKLIDSFPLFTSLPTAEQAQAAPVRRRVLQVLRPAPFAGWQRQRPGANVQLRGASPPLAAACPQACARLA